MNAFHRLMKANDYGKAIQVAFSTLGKVVLTTAFANEIVFCMERLLASLYTYTHRFTCFLASVIHCW